MKTHSTVNVNNKHYSYTLEKKTDDVIRVVCKSANINQEFLSEDVSILILDLPQLIIAEKKYDGNQDSVIRFRVSNEDKKKIEKLAVKKGYESVSDYMRDVSLMNK